MAVRRPQHAVAQAASERGGGGIEPGAVVGDAHDDRAAGHVGADGGTPGAGMLGHVGERLARRTGQRVDGGLSELRRLRPDHDADLRAGGEQPGVRRDLRERDGEVARRLGLVAVDVGAQLLGGLGRDAHERGGVGRVGVAAGREVLEVLEDAVVQPGAQLRALRLHGAGRGGRAMVGALAPRRRAQDGVGASLPHIAGNRHDVRVPAADGRISCFSPGGSSAVGAGATASAGTRPGLRSPGSSASVARSRSAGHRTRPRRAGS